MLFSDALAENLSGPSVTGSGRWLVVDSAATRPRDMATTFGGRIDAIDLLSRGPCDWANCASPALVALPNGALDRREVQKVRDALHNWRYANCFLYLESQRSTGALIEGLHDRTEALLPDRLAVLLRYYDPRVLSVLLDVLTNEQRSSFLEIAARWWMPDRSGDLVECALTESADRPKTFHAPLVFDSLQERALIDAGEADALVDVLLGQRNVRVMQLTPPEQHVAVSDALTSARRFGIDGVPAQAAFCSLYFELGPSFADQEPWRDVLIGLRNEGRSFFDELERIAETA